MSLDKFSAPVDVLRYGVGSSELLAANVHPVKRIEQKRAAGEEFQKLEMSRRTYGVHMAMTLATERQMFQRDGRLPSQTGYSIHSDILRGTENCIEFNDYLSGKYVWVVYR